MGGDDNWTSDGVAMTTSAVEETGTTMTFSTEGSFSSLLALTVIVYDTNSAESSGSTLPSTSKSSLVTVGLKPIVSL